MSRFLLFFGLLLGLSAGSCSIAPDTGWDDGDPFAKVRLLFDS